MPGPGKKFEKGKPGGPGRPKVPSEFKEKCREFTDTVVIEKWKQEVETKGDNWMKAAELLAAYGHGRPAQAVEHDVAQGSNVQIIIRRGEK